MRSSNAPSTIDFHEAVQQLRGEIGSPWSVPNAGSATALTKIVKALGLPPLVVDLLIAAVIDYDGLLSEVKRLQNNGAGPAAVRRATEDFQIVCRTPGTGSDVLSHSRRVDLAFVKRELSYCEWRTLQFHQKHLAALRWYFPELFAVGTPKPLLSTAVLPAGVRTILNRLRLNPYECTWRDAGKPTETPPRTVRPRIAVSPRIEADSAARSLVFEADAPVTIQAAASADTLPTFTMVAYSGGLMYPRGFRSGLVVDLSTTSVLSNPRPMLLSHDETKIVGHGTVANDGHRIVVTDGVISGAGEAADEVRASAKKKFPWKASIGANPGRLETVDAGRYVKVNGRTFKGPITVARDVVIHEVSFVALAGDDTSSTNIAASRASSSPTTGIPELDQLTPLQQRQEIERLRTERSMRETAPIIEAIRLSSDDTNQTVLSHLRRVAIAAGLNLHQPHEILEAMSSGLQGFNAFDQLVRAALFTGFQAGADTTLGWTRRVPLPDYALAEVGAVKQAVRVSRVSRGETAAHVSYGVSKPAGWKLAKFAVQFQIDEQDLVNGLRVGALQLSLEEIGKAFSRLIPDLVYSYLLSNPVLHDVPNAEPDGIPLFHASRGNIGTGGGSALQLSALATGVGAIGNQTLPVERGGVAHLNAIAKYLIVPPQLNVTGRGLAVATNVGDDYDLIVRSESRIGSVGVIDPMADDILEGTATNWLLAAPHEHAPAIFVGTLDGATEPTIRSGDLSAGQWGRWFDISFSVGVLAIDGRGLYWAIGT